MSITHVAGARAGWRRWRLIVGVGVVVSMAVGLGVAGRASAAPVFTPAPGSPFLGLPIGATSGESVAQMAFSPDGRLLATMGYTSVPGGPPVPRFSTHAVEPNGLIGPSLDSVAASDYGGAVAFSPEGRYLAGVGGDVFGDWVGMYSVGPDGALSEVSRSARLPDIDMNDLAFSPDGTLLAAASANDGAVVVFSVQPDGTLTQVPSSPFSVVLGNPQTVAFSPDGKLLATANGAGAHTVTIFSVAPGGALTQVAHSPFVAGQDPVAATFSPNGRLLAVANQTDSSLSLFSVRAGGALTPVAGSPFSDPTEPQSVAFSPSGRLLAAANLFGDTPSTVTGSVPVFSVSSVGLVPVPGSPFPVHQPFRVAFSPNGALLASNTGDGNVAVLALGPPRGLISSPSAGGAYTIGEAVPTSFSCRDAEYAPGVLSCVDSNGATGGSGSLDTSTVGPHVYTVIATSHDGQTSQSTIRYTVLGPDGSGLMSASPTAVSASAAHQRVVLTFTAPPGGLSDGALAVTVPDGWSPPSTSGADPGYTTSSRGSLSVAGQTITVSGLTATAGSTTSIVYGSRTGGGPGANAPGTTGPQTWQTQEQAGSGGTLTGLAVSPQVTVYSADGSSTLIVSPTTVSASSTGNTMVFTGEAAAGGVFDGTVKLTVPAGWSPPSTDPHDPGYTTVLIGFVSVSGQTITVTGTTAPGGISVSYLLYGSRTGGGPGATAPSTTGRQVWALSAKSTPAGSFTALSPRQIVTVRP